MNSFISWVGGKKLLRKKILEQFPDPDSFKRYIEVFGGAGWVLFANDKHAAMDVFTFLKPGEEKTERVFISSFSNSRTCVHRFFQ